MRIEIWSDIACPWCYIGKRRLDRALAAFPHAGEVEVLHRAYLLDPGAPAEPVHTVAEVLGRKYGGGPDAGRAMIDRVEAVAAEEGMLWRHHSSQRVTTLDAHRVLLLAREEGGNAGALLEALYAAYFEQARNVADHDTLVELATGAGLAEDRVREVLAGSDYADHVFEEAAEAGRLGANGVPFAVVDRAYGVPGAQPVEVLTQVLERAWADAHPSLQLVGVPTGSSDEACGPDGCAV